MSAAWALLFKLGVAADIVGVDLDDDEDDEVDVSGRRDLPDERL